MLKKINTHYPLKTMFRLLDNKFKFEITYYLLHNKMRFGELKNSLLDINQQLLTKLLKQLEKDNIIKKKQYKGFPRKVEYSITNFGLIFKPILNDIIKWENKNVKTLTKIIKKRTNKSLYDYY